MQYSKFKLGDLLNFESIRQAKSQKAIPDDNNNSTRIPYIVQSTSDNMFRRNVNKQYLIDHKEPIVKGNCIVLGVTLPAVSYQSDTFGGSQLIVGRSKTDWMNRETGLYLATAIKVHMPEFSYNKKPGMKIYKNMNILLPVTPSGDPDFEYMTNYIRELEAQRIRELEAYLKVTGLDNTTLSASEAQALNEPVMWKKFKIGEIFEIHPSVRKINASAVKFGGKYPYVARGTSTNGIRGYIDWDEDDLNPANTISFGQDTATIYYQDKSYFTGDKIQIFELRDKYPTLNSEVAQFMITCLNAVFGSYTWGQQSFAIKKLRRTEFMLPVTASGDINFEYMQNYIRAVEKQTIKNVVAYKDKVVAETKKVVGVD